MRFAPDVPEHHLLTGLAAVRSGHISAPRAAYRQANLKTSGQYPEAWFNLGLLEREAGRPRIAICAYKRAIALRPKYVKALNSLGLAYAELGDVENAKHSYDLATGIDSGHAASWFNLGRLMLKEEDFGEAMIAFTKAIEVRPDYPEARLNLGLAWSRAGDLASAAATYRDMVQRQPKYVTGWYNLSVVLGRLDRDHEEVQTLETALSVDRNHRPSLKKAARMATSRGDHLESRRLYLELLDADPGDDDVRLSLGNNYRRQKEYARCRQVAEQVLSRSRDNQAAIRLARRCRRGT